MATIRDVEQRMRELVDYPNWERPNRTQRLALINSVIDTLGKFANRAGKPYLVDKFTLTISPNQTTYTIPAEDFEGIEYAVSEIDGHELDIIDRANADLMDLARPRNTNKPLGSARALAEYGVGDDKRIIAFPPQSADLVTVWYNKATPVQPGLDDEVELLDQFHLVLVPAAAALAGMHSWHWDGLSMEEEAAKKVAMQDPQNPWSVRGICDQQQALFKERLYNPAVTKPSRRLQGHGWRRRRLRRLTS